MEPPPLTKQQLRDQNRLMSRINLWKADPQAFGLACMPVADKDEALIRKAVAAHFGTDNNASLSDCLEKLKICSRTVRGQVLERGVFDATLALALSQQRYTDLGQKRMISLTAQLSANVKLDITQGPAEGLH